MRIAITSLVLLAACSNRPATQAEPVDIANAAEEAQESVDNYAAAHRNAPASAKADTPALALRSTPTPAPTPDSGITEAPLVDDGAQAAANVVQAYYALIEQRKYGEAWLLWGDRGRASGMDADAFAAGFAKYRDYHATIGTPGRVDAGAGQRYVTVPVKVSGHLQDGRSFAMEGPITLHRTGDIDGATAEQRSWRISDSGVRPRPIPAE